MNITNLLKVIIYIIIATFTLLFFTNKSNIKSEYIIPVIVTLQLKYYFGDWDKGYQYSYKDITYFFTTFGISYIIVILFK